jgi:hypothetical protein
MMGAARRGPASCHRVSRLIVASSIPLPEAPRAATGETPDLAFDCIDGDPPSMSGWRRYQRWTLPDGRPWASFARRGREFRIEFDGVSFMLSRDRARVRAFHDPAVPLVTVRHLFLDQIVPLVSSLRGQLTLHAGAVATGHGAIAFLGESGTGKSTLVASFAASGESIVADDSVILHRTGDHWTASPSYPGVRLWPETADAVMGAGGAHCRSHVAHYNRKVRVTPADQAHVASSVVLRRIYVLDPQNVRQPSPPIRIEPVSGHDACLALVKHAYRLDFEDAAALRREFAAFASLVEARVIRRLALPFALGELDRVRGAIAEDLVTDPH